MVSRNPDLEFDSLHLCFYPDEDDLHLCSPGSTFPGEDIWKKFALLPACPLAPRRAELKENTPGGAPVPWGEVAQEGFQTHDPLEHECKFLLRPTEADLWGSTAGGDVFKMGFGESKPLNSVIIQDCMWSDFSVREQLARAVSEKMQGKVGAAVTAGASVTATSRGDTKSSSHAELNHSVAPAVMFPFPRSKSEMAPATGGRVGIRVNVSENSQITPQAVAAIEPSTCHTNATSRSGDDALRKSAGAAVVTLRRTAANSPHDEEEGKVEELNVVTAKRRCSSSNEAVTTLTIIVHPKNTTLASVRTRRDELILKPSALIHQQHNYTAFSPYVKSKDTPPQKELKNEVPPPVKPVIQLTSKNSSPQNANLKDRKRRWHQNSLERQRNKILRARFLTLWGHVPELAQSKKAAKVIILKKATDYIHSLETEEQKLLLEKEKLRARQQELVKKIEHLVNC